MLQFIRSSRENSPPSGVLPLRVCDKLSPLLISTIEDQNRHVFSRSFIVWKSVADFEELPLVASFSPTLTELHIGSHDDEPSFSDPFSSLLVPFDILSDGHFSMLTKLHLQAPELWGESLGNSNMAVIVTTSSCCSTFLKGSLKIWSNSYRRHTS